jgi:aminoglycoside phosphotransferase family enzyme/predicted kinase
VRSQARTEQGTAGPTIAGAEVRETHSAVVLLCGDRAYKVKKPVNLGFLDFSTPARRKVACHREYTLNRRMAPDVYLEVLDVLDARGQPRESVLVMKRMPEDRRLATLVRQGVDVTGAMRQLAKQIAAFHSTARTNTEISAAGTPIALAERWRSNITGLRALAPSRISPVVVDEIETLSAAYLAGRRSLLEERARAGWVRDGHGDLLADDIFLLPQGAQVLDCLDFDDGLRWMDVVDDLASLVMDLERLGAADVAEQLVHDYHEFSGAVEPKSLSHHYVAYRAVMRAKVAAIRETTTSGRVKDEAALEAEALVVLGLGHLRAGLPRLVLLGGAPASGKSTVADQLGSRLPAAVLSADRIRKELAGLNPVEHYPEAFGEGLYSPAHTAAVYEALATKARFIVEHGETVVVDASFSTAKQRELFHHIAVEKDTPLVELECTAPNQVLQARLRDRGQGPSRYSDADLVIGSKLAAQRESWPSAVLVNTSTSQDESARQALGTIEAAWRHLP